jgi:ribulose-phosphate 3-epimerase
MTKTIISASILSADFAHLAEQISACEQAGVDWIHVDVMDGAFVPNITMGPFIVETCRRLTRLPLDVHLMINHPERHIEAFAKAGANILTVHIEGNPHIYRTLEQIHSLGCKAGIALNPGTPATAIHEVLPLVDLVLVMTVNPGFSGQQFIPSALPKLSAVAQMLKDAHSSAHLQVDGGITAQTLSSVRQAGADAFVTATAIFKYPAGIAAGVKALRDSA